MGQQLEASLKATVGTSYTEVGVVSLKNYQSATKVIEQVKISLRVLAGGSALNGFRVSERAHRSGFWVISYDTGADWTSPSGDTNILNVKGPSGSSTDPTTLAAGSAMIFEMDQMRATEGLRFEARVASGTADVEINVGSDT